MNYFLITDMCHDGDYEYYDYVAVETKMTSKEVYDNKGFWEECFLAWQFGWVEQVVDNDWWTNGRIVTIEDVTEITKEQFKVLNDLIGGWSLEDIMEWGGTDWTPLSENEAHYGLRKKDDGEDDANI
tara:strand:+ start:661 stop:1041 length:381 start_codon:yes stop_codon:yes gene_type:complete